MYQDLGSLAYCLPHSALNSAVTLLEFCNWFFFLNLFIASIYCMPRLTNNSLSGLIGAGFSLPLASSDSLPVSSSSDSTPVTLPSPVSVQSTSPAVSAFPNTFVSTSTLSLLATSWPLTLPRVASSSWLLIPYNPSNPWPPCNVPPSTASSSSVGGALAFFNGSVSFSFVYLADAILFCLSPCWCCGFCSSLRSHHSTRGTLPISHPPGGDVLSLGSGPSCPTSPSFVARS